MSKSNTIEFFNCSKDGLFTAVKNGSIEPVQLLCGSSSPQKQNDKVELANKRNHTHINDVSKPTVSPDVIHKKLKKTYLPIQDSLQDSVCQSFIF